MSARQRKGKASATTTTAAVAASVTVAEDFSRFTVAMLKAECVKRGLDGTGKKDGLIARLQATVTVDSDEAPPAKLQKQSTIEKAMDAVKRSVEAEKKSAANVVRAPDKIAAAAFRGFTVYKDYDCMLNQTNIGNNNNKFYVIQILTKHFNGFYCFTRWGRVGEPGANDAKYFSTEAAAIDFFKKKFNDKTKNDWEKRDKFTPKSGKYTLVEMSNDGEEDDESSGSSSKSKLVAITPGGKTKASILDTATFHLIQLLFDNDMFKEALVHLEIDVKKMPLGKLSKLQIVKGFAALDGIKKAMEGNKPAKRDELTELSNQFYTAIPHNFGRMRPTVIDTPELLRAKLDMLITLSDIEMTQDMLKKENEKTVEVDVEGLPPHPLDAKYQMLDCKLELLKNSDKEFQLIQNYLNATSNGYRVKKLLNVWRVDRASEGKRFQQHATIDNRKLLWHGTNVAVVAAILKSGLRIMPHSGGRVGKGIYFASENSKSAGYGNHACEYPSLHIIVCPAKNNGIMFLNEVALGKEHHITCDDGRLCKAPDGFHSVIARGHTEPDPKLDTKFQIEGKEVIIPQGKPIHQPQYSCSTFTQSEYLVYQESQVRIRYMLQLQM